jgi:hypothetical protein
MRLIHFKYQIISLINYNFKQIFDLKLFLINNYPLKYFEKVVYLNINLLL